MHGAFNLTGRPRKPGPRYPSGDLRPEKDVDILQLARVMPHRLSVPEADMHDYRAESPFGRLYLRKQITPLQYGAGMRYRSIMLRMKALWDSPTESPPSMSGIIIGRFGRGRELTSDEIASRRDDYNAAFEYLESHAGHRCAVAVAHWITDRDDMPLDHLRCGLNVLARHFDLTDRAKS